MPEADKLIFFGQKVEKQQKYINVWWAHLNF